MTHPTTEQRELLEHARRASKAEAHLYAWAAVEAILTSGATPDRQDAEARKQVDRVLKICRDECRRLLRIHDKHIAAIAKGEKE